MQNDQARHALALALVLVAGVIGPAAADTAQGTITTMEFDEIDHVYTTGAVPPPGSFRQNAGLAAQTAPTPEPAKRGAGVFGVLSRASTVLGGAGSVVSASGEIARTLRIADDVSKLAPLTTALGMAGSRRFDALLQTYMLPRVSPTGAVMLQGFLAAQAEYKSHFGTTRAESPQAPAPAQLEPYAKGAIRHYTIASNGWVRIDDPNTKLAIIIKPDVGKSYLIDAGSKTVRVNGYSRAAPASDAPGATGSGTAAVEDRVESIGKATLDGIAAVGFRTRSTMRVAGGGGTCPDTTITSTRVEYFAPYRIASDAANTSPTAQRPDGGGCEPKSSVKHGGGKVPADQLVVYEANTVEKTTAGGTDKYTFVLERGNLQERGSADPAAFEIPAGFRQVSS